MVDVVVEMKIFSSLITIKEEENTMEVEVSEEEETIPVGVGAENREETEMGAEIFVTINVGDLNIINLHKKKVLGMGVQAEGSTEAEDVLLGGRIIIILKK